MIRANEYNIWDLGSIQPLNPLAVVGLFPRGQSCPGRDYDRLPVLVSMLGTREALAVPTCRRAPVKFFSPGVHTRGIPLYPLYCAYR